ncbi:MAG: hypothetical protein AB1767_03390 [Bacillota bacterium]
MQYRTLANLHSPTLGSDSSDNHAAANSRVYQDMIQFILEHEDQYPQINVDKNIMVQLVTLSEEQIKQIAIAIFESNYPGEPYR